MNDESKPVFVKLHWIDSGLSFANTWLDKQTIIERALNWTGECTAVGQIVYQDRDRIVLCLIEDEEKENYAACFLISQKCIISSTILDAPRTAG